MKGLFQGSRSQNLTRSAPNNEENAHCRLTSVITITFRHTKRTAFRAQKTVRDGKEIDHLCFSTVSVGRCAPTTGEEVRLVSHTSVHRSAKRTFFETRYSLDMRLSVGSVPPRAFPSARAGVSVLLISSSSSSYTHRPPVSIGEDGRGSLTDEPWLTRAGGVAVGRLRTAP